MNGQSVGFLPPMIKPTPITPDNRPNEAIVDTRVRQNVKDRCGACQSDRNEFVGTDPAPAGELGGDWGVYDREVSSK